MPVHIRWDRTWSSVQAATRHPLLPGQALLAHELAHTIQQRIGQGGDYHTAEREANRVEDSIRRGAPVNVSSPGAHEPMQRQPAPEQDKERETIVGVTKRTGDMRSRAGELVWRLLTRYFPEYKDKISGVGYDAKEMSVRVQVMPIEIKGKKTQSAQRDRGRPICERQLRRHPACANQ